MLDPDDPKESLLNELQWTEASLKEVVRTAVTKYAKAMTFAMTPDDPKAPEFRTATAQRIPLSPPQSRIVTLVAVMSCAGASHPEIFSMIRMMLEGHHIRMTYDNQSNNSMMIIRFEADRFKPIT